MRDTEVKICGVCCAPDAALAASAGADYIGVILAPGRPRTRTLTEAAEILAATPAARVGVFVNASPEEVVAAAQQLALDAVQLHGDESAADVRVIAAAGSWQVWKAIRVSAADDITRAHECYGTDAHALLLDGYAPHAHGGAGVAFDWDAAARARAALPPAQKVVVAGGLNPQNVARVIALLRPDVVDVSSGVEASLCRKSAQLVHDFIVAARGAKDTA